MSRLVGATSRRYNSLAPTRHDFAQLNAHEIEPGMKIRSMNYEKWVVEDIAGYDIRDLPTLSKAQVASTSEAELPPVFVVKHSRKPKWIIRQVQHELAGLQI